MYYLDFDHSGQTRLDFIEFLFNNRSTYRFDPIEGEKDFDVPIFTSVEKAVIDSVIQNFCCYSGKMLECFTHSEMPWLKNAREFSC